ncbi:MAG: tripartite tricarboxylate transporter substrate-binding protein [Pigmentiphaga sp.]
MKKQTTKLCCLILLGLAPLAHAEANWPTKPIKLIVSHAPGSSPDVLARYLSARLADQLPQPLVIENRPGGQNIIGSQAAARATPDGYTLFYGTTGALVSNVYTIDKLPYDPKTDFTPVRFIGYSPFMVAAYPGFEPTTLKQAIDLSMRHTDKVSVATEASKTFSGILASALKETGKAQWSNVPYSKSSEAIQDTIAGRTQLVVLPTAVVLTQVQEKRLKALAVNTKSRLSNQPDVPTIAETFPGFDFSAWHMLVAPAGTPTPILTRLNEAISQVLAAPEVKHYLESLGIATDPALSSLAANRDFLKKEHETWAGLVQRLGIQPE